MKTTHMVLVLTFILSSLGTSSAAVMAQTSESTYTSVISELVIDIGASGEAAFYPQYNQVLEGDGYQEEHIALYHGVSLIYITITDTPTSPADRNEEAHAAQAPSVISYTILDEHADETSRWFLASMRYLLDFPRIKYVESYDARFGQYSVGVTVYSSPALITDTIDWLVTDVTIDGEPLMMMGDYSHLESLLDGTSDVTPTIYDDHATTVLDWMRYGLISRTQWESPSFGTSVTWSDPWQFNFLRYSSIQITADQSDTIRLKTDDYQSQVSIRVEPAEGDNADPQYWADLWSSEEWGLASGYNMTAIDARVTEDTVTVVLDGSGSYGEPFIAIFSMYIDDDGTAYFVDILSTREHVVDAVQQYEDLIQVNGTPIPLAFTPEEIDALFGD